MKKYSIRNFTQFSPFSNPCRKAKIEKNTNIENFNNYKPKRLKPQIINPQSFILSHQTLTTFKNHI